MTYATSTDRTALYRRELLTRMLPWWETNAIDPNGGVFTCFSNEGTLVSQDKYTWSQGRWAWLCAELADTAEFGILPLEAQLWRERASDTGRHLERTITAAGSDVAFITTREGDHLPANGGGDIAVSVYADLFAALGLVNAAASAGEATATERERWNASAHRILESAARRVRDGSAPSEPYPVPAEFADLGRTMLLMSVATEIHLRTGSDASRIIVEEAMARITGPDGQWSAARCWEFKPQNTDDGFDDTLLANHLNPGHVLELSWMLLDAASVSSVAAALLPEWLSATVLTTLALGWDEGQGGLFRFVDHRGGAPIGRRLGDSDYENLVLDTWDTKLWWVHIEALLACEIFAIHTGDPAFDVWANRVADYTFSTFPDAESGEWIQIRDRSGAPLDKVVALPVKDPFHVPRALIRMVRLAERTATL